MNALLTALIISLFVIVVLCVCLYRSRQQCVRLDERLRLLSDTEPAQMQFRQIASDVLRQSAGEIADSHSRQLGQILEPLKHDVERMEKTFSEAYMAESRERFSLTEHIRSLQSVNETIGRETRRLSDALRGNSRVQGEMGEILLESILEHSGLQRGRDFLVQAVAADESGVRLRPDVVLVLPEDRHIIIDSKVSISAYLTMLDTDDPAAAKAAASAHVASVKKHIAELRTKKYQANDARSAEFVLMFIPYEGAYLAALQADASLWQTAYDSGVVIVSPTHLMSVVKLVEQLWQQQSRSTNAIEIARQASAMLEKLRGFLEDIDKIDRGLRSLRDTFDSAHDKLSTGKGNLISRADKLRRLGVSVSKRFPDAFESTIDPDDLSED